MYHNNQLDVDVKLPLIVEFNKIDGINKAVQIFPDDEEFADMYIVYVDPSKLETVFQELEKHPGVNSVARIPIRKLV